MRKSRFSEAQIVEILKEGEAGIPVSDLIRKHGISETWLCEYNQERPHESLGSLPPLSYMPRNSERAAMGGR